MGPSQGIFSKSCAPACNKAETISNIIDVDVNRITTTSQYQPGKAMVKSPLVKTNNQQLATQYEKDGWYNYVIKFYFILFFNIW